MKTMRDKLKSLLRDQLGLVSVLRLFWRADRAVFVGLAAITVALAVLPNLLVVATGRFVDAVPPAVSNGLRSDAGRGALGALLAVCGIFALSGVLVALVRWVVEIGNSRFAGQFATEVGRSLLAPRSIEALEDSVTADRIDGLRELETSGAHLQTIPSARMVLSRRLGAIGAAVILFGLSWWAPLVMIIGWSLARWGSSRWMRRGFNAAAASEGSTSLRRAEYLHDLVMSEGSAKEMRLFGLGDWLLSKYKLLWCSAMDVIWSARKTSSRDLLIGIAVVIASHALVFIEIGSAVSSGSITAGATVTFGMAVIGTADLGFLGDQEWRLARGGNIVRQLNVIQSQLDVVDSPTQHDAVSAQTPAAIAVGGTTLELDDVSFAYGDGRPVLTGLNLRVPAGQSLAIVGENGAGKSTLLKLLCGLYTPSGGSIHIDGVDVGAFDRSEFSSKLGVVFQEFLKYELPLRENVAFGALGLMARTDRLDKAAYDAGADDIVDSLPHGWDTVLSPGYKDGVDLSGGQWQRVALARALLSVDAGAGLLVLDEPTSNLDIRSEIELFERFLDGSRGVTTVLVSHRLSGVKRAERIVVLSDGAICEDGSHSELMELNGKYAAMFRLQAERFGIEEGL